MPRIAGCDFNVYLIQRNNYRSQLIQFNEGHNFHGSSQGENTLSSLKDCYKRKSVSFMEVLTITDLKLRCVSFLITLFMTSRITLKHVYPTTRRNIPKAL